MFVAMIVLFSEAIMMNAVWPQGCCSRRVHIALHFLILSIALTGVSIVIAFHFQAGFPNFVSVHSYVGLSTLILLVLQNVVGALIYYCDCCDAWRVAYIPKHRFFGVVIFIVALAAVTLGLFDKQSLIRNADELSTAKLIPNVLAVIVISIGQYSSTAHVPHSTHTDSSRCAGAQAPPHPSH
jgi:cytochrome b-561